MSCLKAPSTVQMIYHSPRAWCAFVRNAVDRPAVSRPHVRVPLRCGLTSSDVESRCLAFAPCVVVWRGFVWFETLARNR